MQIDVDFALADRLGRIARRIDDLVDAAIPHDDRARAVVAGRNHALEVAVLERMVFDGDCKMLVGGIHRGAFRNRPRAQDAFHLESEIVVEAARRVLLYDERCRWSSEVEVGTSRPNGSGVRAALLLRRYLVSDIPKT